VAFPFGSALISSPNNTDRYQFLVIEVFIKIKVYQEAIDIYKRILLDNRYVYIYVFEVFWFFSINSFKITDFIGNIFWQVNKKKSDKFFICVAQNADASIYLQLGPLFLSLFCSRLFGPKITN
jgi:hypothetical protein